MFGRDISSHLLEQFEVVCVVIVRKVEDSVRGSVLVDPPEGGVPVGHAARLKPVSTKPCRHGGWNNLQEILLH